MRVAFTLFDKDSFKLIEIEGSTRGLYSGQRNVFQDTVREVIPLHIAQRTARISPKIIILCSSCDRPGR